MRYPRGSVQLSECRDIPLLREILHAEFVTHSQLFELMRLRHHERNRKSFNWRVKRLVDAAIVRRRVFRGCVNEFVYSVSQSAANVLLNDGGYCLLGPTRLRSAEFEQNILHSIGLNEIQLTTLRSGSLVRWVSSLEIRSQNELTAFGFAKDYDAVITVRLGQNEVRLAVEYERSPKSTRRYAEIASALSYETHLEKVLYLVSNYDLLRFVCRFFANSKVQVLFGLAKDWHACALDMAVSLGPSVRSCRLRDAICAPNRPTNEAKEAPLTRY